MSRILVANNYYSNNSREIPYKWSSVEVLKFNKYSSASGNIIYFYFILFN